jgi:hypothetical protein
MCESFFNMKAGTKSALPTHNEPAAAVPTPIQGSEHVQQVIYFKIITCSTLNRFLDLLSGDSSFKSSGFTDCSRQCIVEQTECPT